jgi:hypothetical protein
MNIFTPQDPFFKKHPGLKVFNPTVGKTFLVCVFDNMNEKDKEFFIVNQQEFKQESNNSSTTAKLAT